MGREDDVAIYGVAREDVAILVGAENGEGAEQGGAVVVVGDGLKGSFQLAVGGEGFDQSHQIGANVRRATGLRHRRLPEEVGGVSLGAEDFEGCVGEEDGEEGVGEDFEDAGGMDGVRMGSGGEGEVCFVLETQDQLGQQGGVEVELLARGGAGGAGLAAPGEDAAGEEGVGAAVVEDDAEAGGEGAVDTNAEEVGPTGDEGAEVFESESFVGAGVEALPAEGGGGDFQEAEAGGASGL